MRRSQIALVIAVVALMVLAWRLGLYARFSDVEAARATLLGLGAYGYAAFVLAYALFQPFGVPGTVFIWVAPLVWPWEVAFALSMAGTMAASVVGFSFARFVAREQVAARIPARFRTYEEALERRAFATVVALRFIFWMPPALHAFFGVSRVSFATHFWGSLVGYIVPLLVVSYFGARAFAYARSIPVWVWLALVAGGVAVAVLVWLLRRRGKSRARSAT